MSLGMTPRTPRRGEAIDATARTAGSAAGDQGFTLLEMLVYMSIWVIIVGFGFTLFYRAMTSSKRQARAGDELVQALQAGERWRGDVRRTLGAVGWVPAEDGGGQMLRLPTEGGDVDYRFTGTNVVRRAGSAGPWLEVISRARSSDMVRDARGGVGSWRWELELAVRENPVRVRPLFTFQAVPRGGSKP